MQESGFGRLDDVQLIRVQESYRSDFVGRDHSVFLSSEGVVCIMAAQTRNSHVVLVLDAGGYRRMTLPAPQLAGKDFCQGCLQWISANVFPGVDVYMVEDDAALKASLAQIESMAPENSSCFRIGVVYATDADESEEQMFDHKASQAFLDFLRIISDEIELLGWGGFRGQLSVRGLRAFGTQRAGLRCAGDGTGHVVLHVVSRLRGHVPRGPLAVRRGETSPHWQRYGRAVFP